MKVIKIDATLHTSIFLIKNGNIYTSGWNGYGANGINQAKPLYKSLTKIYLENDDIKFIDVKVGRLFVIALSKNGIIYGWGQCSEYQLTNQYTDGSYNDSINKPMKIDLIKKKW